MSSFKNLTETSKTSHFDTFDTGCDTLDTLNLSTPKNVNFKFIDRSGEATHCNYCGKPLTENAIRFINGEGFCNNLCAKLFNNQELYGAKIREVLNSCTKALYRDSNIDQLRANVCDPRSVDRVLSWRYTKGNPQGLIIYGDSGAGKTRTLTQLLKSLIVKDLVGVLNTSLKVFYAGKLEEYVMQSFERCGNYSKVIAELGDVGLLVIDDFGKEKFTERFEVALFSIFESRISSLKPTIFTTNFAGESFRKRFTSSEQFDPFYRRIKEFNEAIYFKKKGN